MGRSAVGLCAVLSGCAALTRVPANERPAFAREDGLCTLVGAVHVHSFRSHDCRASDELIEAAAHAAGLDFVLFTDHRRSSTDVAEPGREWQSEGTVFLPGYEVNAAGGSLLLLGTPVGFDASGEADAVAQRARGLGARVGLGHVEEIGTAPDVGAETVEIYNLHAAARDASVPKLIAAALFLPASWFMDHLSALDPRSLAFADRATVPRGVVFGCDAHGNVRVLWGVLGTFASYDDAFRSVTTHVLVRQRSRDGLLDALAHGRSYGVFERRGDARGFAFACHAGAAVVPMGEQVTLRGGERGTMVIEAPIDAQLRLTRDGAVVSETTGRELRVPVATGGRYRALVFRDGDPWIVSSAIDLVAPDAAADP